MLIYSDDLSRGKHQRTYWTVRHKHSFNHELRTHRATHMHAMLRAIILTQNARATALIKADSTPDGVLNRAFNTYQLLNFKAQYTAAETLKYHQYPFDAKVSCKLQIADTFNKHAQKQGKLATLVHLVASPTRTYTQLPAPLPQSSQHNVPCFPRDRTSWPISRVQQNGKNRSLKCIHLICAR